ncbi:MAG: hypothetical protein HKN43_06100 [Rhodothermales bacterium]|nr:hypothetical protein [Rhodothermales bacterium]
MSRIINTGDTAAKRRNRHMRSCAEVIRILATRSGFDPEGMDMAAFLVFNLRDIYDTIEESAKAWDDKNYWKKAENLRQKWRWSHLSANRIEQLILTNRWDDITIELLELIPQFSSIKITSITRDSDWWAGALKALRRNAAELEEQKK